VSYIQVDDLEAARDRAVRLGATLVGDSTAGPAGTSVTIADSGGALFALFVPHPS
jgi:predicted enzyme related to lactoylglutathione lyase